MTTTYLLKFKLKQTAGNKKNDVPGPSYFSFIINIY